MKIIAAFAVGLALAVALPAVSAQAQNARSFVSAHGSDSAACTLAAPCRTLAAALAATNAGGEIDVLDPAGYGALTIDKAISIVNDGVGTAGVIVPSGGTGIIINAGPNDAVSLRGLSVEGGGVGATGIKFNSGASLTVEKCVIRHVTGNGIDFTSTTATSALTVANSLVADNGAAGINLLPSGSATAEFNRVEANNNGFYGILVAGDSSSGTNTVNATVSDSVAAGNGNAGFYSSSPSGHAPTSFMVSHSVTANNGIGVDAFGPGVVVRLANSTVTGNASGWQAVNGGVISSYGDNYIDGNGSNTGSLTPPDGSACTLNGLSGTIVNGKCTIPDGTACPLNHASGTTLNGTCTIQACFAGFADCNNQAVDGCEVNVSTDRNNCGSCGRVCAVGKTCIAGACS
jgi:Right handed beta helix region